MKLSIYSALIGLCALALSYAFDFHRSIDLPALFLTRGEIKANPQVIMVAMNRESADTLAISSNPADWPRAMHAKLIDRLSEYSPSVIALDVFFSRAKEEQSDELLASAISESSKVVLIGYLQRELGNVSTQQVSTEKLQYPYQIFNQAAAAVAPFPLPKSGAQVDQYWSFRENAGDLPTFPTSIITQHLKEEFLQLAQQISALIGKTEPLTSSEIRRALRTDPLLLSRLRNDASKNKTQTHSLLSLFSGSSFHYFNFYGAPYSINTVNYADIMTPSVSSQELEKLIRNKIVIVGYAAQQQPEQRDNFYTVFTRDDGLDISGVELAATAVANFLDNNTPQELPLYVSVLFALLVSLSLFVLYRRKSIALLILGSAVLISLVLISNYWMFSTYSSWFHAASIGFIQVPLSLFMALFLMHQQAHRLKGESERQLSLHIPKTLSDRYARDKLNPSLWKDRAYGVCLYTDAKAFTNLGEQLDSEHLHSYLNQYYTALFPAITSRDGIIMDIAGDALLAVWPCEQPCQAECNSAIEAALEMQSILAKKASESDLPLLTTRIGIHAGEISLGSVGADTFYQFRAVGDSINTASRIQAANKRLGSLILVSDTVSSVVERDNTRELGRFMLRGKSSAINLVEILSPNTDSQLLSEFQHALALFQRQDYRSAQHHFEAILSSFPEDGPSRFYLNLTKTFLETPQQTSDYIALD
ncbi:MAG: adenylate/guanylate cyclase domain-containing protein [Gammaproteobacteria bacterium]|nr:adenylate/guanylate cyclase domain-containing protein [Gammaproteobacteria bacterium]